ncbi:MAG: hypothetical protein MUO24_04055 [Desulfobacterales bacterium]|nr:hypothetical protein [Desulfobacterales bacterium]
MKKKTSLYYLGSRPGMKLAMEFFKILLIHRGVDLGRADYHVLDHRLDKAEIGTLSPVCMVL